MAEWWAVWWSYGLSDFLMFSPAAYARLFERYNAAVWPLQLPMLAAGMALLLSPLSAARWPLWLLVIAWLWVAWAFHWQRYAQINWAAAWFAAGFALQALLLALATRRPAPLPRRRWPGLALIAWGLLAQPLLGLALGRSWRGVELFGLASDPTVLASLGLLLMRPGPWWLWPIPLLWCAISGATLWTLKAPEALLLPAAALLSLLTLLGSRRPASR